MHFPCKFRLAALLTAATGLTQFSPAVLATEGALGRPITAMQIAPYAGLIPPTPGMSWSLNYIHYTGKISGSREVPIAGQTTLGLEVDLDLYLATGIYIWPTEPGRWNFASALTLPYIDSDVRSSLSSRVGTAGLTQNASDLYDLSFAPVIASYHVDDSQHLSFTTYIYAPTADYDAERLANPGANVWTLSPTLGYTKLLKVGVEISAQAAFDWYSRNHQTDFRNGTVGRVEALMIMRQPSGWGSGIVAGWIEQLEDDDGPGANRLDGFKGRSVGVGPILSYERRFGDGQSLGLNLRYIDEFNVRNRFEGESWMLNANIKF